MVWTRFHDIRIVRASEIKDEWRSVSVPTQVYVWVE
jgi:hypothetical protein